MPPRGARGPIAVALPELENPEYVSRKVITTAFERRGPHRVPKAGGELDATMIDRSAIFGYVLATLWHS
jgi:hypothetical protein